MNYYWLPIIAFILYFIWEKLGRNRQGKIIGVVLAIIFALCIYSTIYSMTIKGTLPGWVSDE